MEQTKQIIKQEVEKMFKNDYNQLIYLMRTTGLNSKETQKQRKILNNYKFKYKEILK